MQLETEPEPEPRQPENGEPETEPEPEPRQPENGEPETEPEPEPGQPLISQAHTAARNVLDALGVGLDDLPNEPPTWMEQPADNETASSPPSVYKELVALGHEDAATNETDAEEPAIENLDDTEPPETDEPVDLDEAVEEAAGAIEEPTIEEPAIENLDDTEPPETDEPVDLDEAVEEAISAIEEPTIENLEPVLPEEGSSLDVSGSGEGAVAVESGSVTWGAGWQDAAQGWVQQEGGRSTWRPIITTTPQVGAWEIDTFLGIVAGDATLTDVEHDLPVTRRRAIQSMVDQALSRGAHAVVGVRTEIQEIGGIILVGALGTAVTLKSPE